MLFATVADGIANCDLFSTFMFAFMADVLLCVSVVDVRPLTDASFWQMLYVMWQME